MKSKSSHKQSWDPLAAWYDGWMGQHGSRHHRRLAIPTVLALLQLRPGDRLLDLGAGQGVLAPYVAQMNAQYVGIEISPRLVSIARRRHGEEGTFLKADARCLPDRTGLEAGTFTAVVFLLSLQDMHPMLPALHSAAWALKPGGCTVLLLTHPCFRIPRQSGWGWDNDRRLRFRRIDRYLTRMEVPMKAYSEGHPGVSRSYHRPLSAYVNALSQADMLVQQLVEVPSDLQTHKGRTSKARRRADREIPLFLGIRALKIS